MSNAMLRALPLLLLLAGCGYVEIGGGRTDWPDRSNQNGVEGRRIPGWMGSIEGGYQTSYARLGGSLSYVEEQLHGKNRRLTNGELMKQSADGEELYIVSGTLKVSPFWKPVDWLSLYAGAGVGASYIVTLEDQGVVPHFLLEAGTRFHLGRHATLSLGYEYFKADGLGIGPYSLRYDRHGPRIGFGWEF